MATAKKIHPKETALLYIRDIMYVSLRQNQLWEVVPRIDGKHEVKRDCLNPVLENEEFHKYFNTEVEE